MTSPGVLGAGEGSGAVRGVAVLGLGMIAAALFGLLFQSLLSFLFGAGAETDAYFMSVSIFAFVSKFLMLGQLKSIALPLYGGGPVDGRASGQELLGGMLKAALSSLSIVALVVALAAPLLVRLLAPGFDEPASRLTATLLRIRAPALLFAGFVTLARIALEHRSDFGLAVFTQSVVPAVSAFALLWLVGARATISDVAWIGLGSTAAGGLLLWALRPGLLRGSTRAALQLGTVRQALRAWLRFSQSTAATFMGEWAFRVGASILPVGAFSAVLYGRMVHDVAHGAINDPASTVTLPHLARAHRAGGIEAAGTALRHRVVFLVAVTAPLATLLVILAPWIVAILFGRGRFLEDGMHEATALALAIFAVGFLVQGVNQLLFAGAFAVGESERVNRVNVIGHASRAVALIPMVWAFGLAGLVGAQVAMNVLVLGLVVASWPRGLGLRGPDDGPPFWGGVARVVLAAVPAAGLIAVALAQVGDPLAHGLTGRLLVAVAATTGFLAVYIGMAAAVGVPIRDGVEVLRRGLGRPGMDPAARP